MAPQPTKTIHDLQPGDHLCLIYGNEEEHRDVLTAFVRDSLMRNEKVLYVADDHTPAVLIDYLQDEPHLARCIGSGQLQVLTAVQAYLRDGSFDPDRTIALFTSELEQALAEGYTALRATGELTWLFRGAPGVTRFFEYESKMNEFFRGRQAIGLCQYHRRTFPPAVLMEALLTHPLACLGRTLIENRAYLPPAEYQSLPGREAALERLFQSLGWQPKAAPGQLESGDIDALLTTLGLPASSP